METSRYILIISLVPFGLDGIPRLEFLRVGPTGVAFGAKLKPGIAGGGKTSSLFI